MAEPPERDGRSRRQDKRGEKHSKKDIEVEARRVLAIEEIESRFRLCEDGDVMFPELEVEQCVWNGEGESGGGHTVVDHAAAIATASQSYLIRHQPRLGTDLHSVQPSGGVRGHNNRPAVGSGVDVDSSSRHYKHNLGVDV